MPSSHQIRAARQLLNLEQVKLAKMTGLAVGTVSALERHGCVSDSSLIATTTALEDAGIEFLDGGVRLVKERHE